MKKVEQLRWWQTGIIYQVYPRSFKDSNNDGVGDLAGIRQKLDYFRWLGVDALWISPVYPSPMADFGYDISDYTDIHPLFGTMHDFDLLLKEAHQLGLKVILDLVPNHTSVEHPWFKEARVSKHSSKRNWYLWQDAAADGGPPNNWLSVFGGSAWEWDEPTGQYYYHAYLKEQPDLNWRNPEVQQAMFSIMRFWLDKGVDGFRVDVMWHMIKDNLWRNNPPNPVYTPEMPPYFVLDPAYSVDQPEVHEVVANMRKVLEEYNDRVMIAEIYLPIPRLVTYYGKDNQGAHLPFNFQLITLPWQARAIAAAIDHYEAALPDDGWPNWVLGNHDKARIATRAGHQQAKVAAMLLLTLRGTPTLYYGDELGMENVFIPPEKVQDPWELNVPGMGLNRDPVRTPMQWNSKAYGGFSGVEPWLPLETKYAEKNVETLRADRSSILSLYRSLIALRKKEEALSCGDFIPVPAAGDIITYIRKSAGKSIFVALNLGDNKHVVRIGQPGSVVLSTDAERINEHFEENLPLSENEGVIAELEVN